jgi:Ca2+-binding EF-hand superfamily protein
MGSLTSRANKAPVNENDEQTRGSKTTNVSDTAGRGDTRGECEHSPQHKQYFMPPKGPELNPNDYAFLCEHTGKSRDEINVIFHKYNLDKPDAKLNKDDFKKIYQDLHPDSATLVDDIAEQVFYAFDSDCTGFISFNEFMVAYALTSHADMRKKIEYAFDLYDFGGIGYVESNELRSIIVGMLDVLGFEKRHDNPTGLIEKTIESIKTTESGRVTKGIFEKKKNPHRSQTIENQKKKKKEDRGLFCQL